MEDSRILTPTFPHTFCGIPNQISKHPEARNKIENPLLF
jgi:hypothetical protein